MYVRHKQHIFIWRYKSSYMFRLFIWPTSGCI